MEFLVLGPLEVRRDGQPVELRGSKRRALLALLVLHANEVVRSDRLVDELWGDKPPRNAPAALQNHVFRLRKDLGPDVLVTKPWGYVLRVDRDRIDLRRFECLVTEARTLPAEERFGRLRDALALWRGPALADVADEPALVSEVARLEELRLSALEQRVDAELELGGHSGLVPELEDLVAQHPLREQLRGQLILGLYRAGRQAEALETYRETRRVLIEELGIEPSPELRELERAILRQDPALAVSPAPPGSAPPADEERRFRWPRSPLVLAAAALLLAGGGAAAAVAVTRGGPGPSSAASTIPRRSTTTTQAKQQATSTVAPEQRPRTLPPNRPPATTSEIHVAPKATTAQPPPPPEQPADRQRPAITTAQSRPPRQQPSGGQLPAVTTAPQTTTKAKPPTKPTPRKTEPFTIADDFSRPVLDPTIWHIIGRDFGGLFDQSNGRLEITLLADAQPDPAWDTVGGHYGTRCRFTGDFDASVDFELLTWRRGTGAYAGLNAFFADSAVLRQSSAQWGDQYASWVSSVNGAIPLEDMRGKLRLRRVGARITTYFWYGGGWRRIVSGTSTGPATLGLQVQADGDEFSHTEVRVAFDNFVVKATEADCPPGSDPRNR